MSLSNQLGLTTSVSHDDLRNTLQIIERAWHYKDVTILQAILGVALHMPSSTHALYEHLQVYQGGLLERITEKNPRYYLYSDAAVTDAKKELYRCAFGDFNEALWLLKYKSQRAAESSVNVSSIIRPEYFTEKQRMDWNTAIGQSRAKTSSHTAPKGSQRTP
ncbi:MAG: hypothetical protein ACREGE_00875 [Candidatus Microsaccharimonas sp.]